MLYSINSSPILVTKSVFKLIFVFSNYQTCTIPLRGTKAVIRNMEATIVSFEYQPCTVFRYRIKWYKVHYKMIFDSIHVPWQGPNDFPAFRECNPCPRRRTTGPSPKNTLFTETMEQCCCKLYNVNQNMSSPKQNQWLVRKKLQPSENG